jgi:3-hydroxy-9,10-secoandrosta-1,3,5(10)-triene-9,17-dione monooxygenase
MRRYRSRGLKVHALVPIDELEVDDTWHVMGLRGTGSKDVVARDIFVPAVRTVDSRAFLTGTDPNALRHSTNLYRLAMDSVLSVAVATAVLGAARFALRHFVERARERKVISSGTRRTEHTSTQLRFAKAAAEIRCAELLINDQLAEFERLSSIGEGMNKGDRAQAKWQAAYATELCRRSVIRLFAGAGAHASYSSSPLQAAFRNINVAAQHASIDFDTSAEDYGRLHLTGGGATISAAS